jgi:hypothetical protein
MHYRRIDAAQRLLEPRCILGDGRSQRRIGEPTATESTGGEMPLEGPHDDAVHVKAVHQNHQLAIRLLMSGRHEERP